MHQAKGTFDIRRTPEPGADFGDGVQAMRLRFDKTFHGPLTATSVVYMLGVMDPTTGSGGYVALERIVGTLDGQAGSFMLQHSSLMDHGIPSQSIQVIPGSGTGALAGLRGTLTIDIVDGAHFYTFDYALAG
ncbi:DUF3224 domain-containing protein [Lysobacter brunescens]|uniref:DUF3224 domain-containing protein n=1 Tax=Lysobacter brunescens TaxID=262323 RepID=A0ABW2YB14_9GAMM